MNEAVVRDAMGIFIGINLIYVRRLETAPVDSALVGSTFLIFRATVRGYPCVKSLFLTKLVQTALVDECDM